MSHKPVMLNETLAAFSEAQIPMKTIMDGTFGRGGHTRALMQKFPEAKVWAMDQDADAIDFGQKEFATEITKGSLVLVQGNFDTFSEKLVPKTFDGVLLDLGVSSPQLDEAGRGFSFYNDGPLDMRMDRNQKILAEDIVNGWSEEELIEMFVALGEIRNPSRVVRAIVHDRRETPYKTTRQLASMIERVCRWQRRGFHPATQYFMALRLQVNRELRVLEDTLPILMRALNDKGRAVVITFHSLEDRIVKNIFKSNPELGRPVSKKVVKPTRDEEKTNPRSRSAKLRVFERGVYEH